MTSAASATTAATRVVTATVRALTMIAACAIAVVATAAADGPVPPTPDEAATEVQPVAFAVPENGERPTRPLPLSGVPSAERPVTANRAPLRPLGDWTVLVAIAAAFALVAAFRFTSLRRSKSLPPDVFELLGEASLGGPQAVRVVRFGPRTLLIGVSASGCQTLAELDDPQATERIAIACRSESATGRAPPRGPRLQPPAKPAGGEAA